MTFDPAGPPIMPGHNQPYTLASVMPAPAVKPRVHPASIVLAVVGGVALLCGGILGIGGLAATTRATPSASPVYIYTATPVPVPAAVAPTTTTAPPAPPPPATPIIKEGTWTVGTDIAPGTYRTTADVSSSCYWQITKSGSNGGGIGDIIANDLPGGGRPSVTLEVGHDFKTNRCGTWALVS
jgi:hypothetical protein